MNKELENAWAVQEIWQDKCYKLEQENKKLKSDLEKFSEAYKKYRDYEKEELAESCYDLERENQKLKEELEHIHGFDSFLIAHGFKLEDLYKTLEK